ncbi:uncharacterized protein LOC119138415 [Syngnathus acus]|uniref:uncharacterized protein LOC119138415 n=1 Tax=Syngnathus acus TaxID=161584 RepID=UPI001885FDBD|nr:uncharacterized protein LOC119138415 [Syngnathus acus]
MKPVRPHSEIYPAVCCSVSPSVSYSSLTEGPMDDGDANTPIFSVSKSSMDVFKRDPTWTGLDLRRSSSANVEQGTLQELHGWRRVGSLQSSDGNNPAAISERLVANMRRWSRCSGGGSVHSRSSTPDTVVWVGSASRPGSLAKDVACCAPSSSSTTLTSSPFISPFISPLLTPTLPSVKQYALSPASPLESATTLLPEHGDSPGSPLASTTLPPEPFFRLRSTEDDTSSGNRLLYFQYPSPMASSVCSEEGVSPSPGCLPDEETPQISDGQVQVSTSVDEERELDEEGSVCHLQLPWQPQPRRSPLVSSLSDSLLGEGCRCSRGGAQREPIFKEKAQQKMVDAAVQTLSPTSSWLDLHSNTSHSLLGSPPGSKLDLKASVDSNSNLVSPSSSMIPPSESEEDEKLKDVLGRRRSCLKTQAGEEKKEPGGRRRSSMKQVQWDEDGMTWDVHGASLEPEMLTAAIRKHLELHNSLQTVKRPSKKKSKAPAPPSVVLPDATPPDNAEEMIQDKGAEKEEAPREVSKDEEGDAVNDNIPKSPSLSRGTIRKRSVIRSLRPGWCGGSKKEDD